MAPKPRQISGLGAVDPGLGLARKVIEIDGRGQHQPRGEVELRKEVFGRVFPAHVTDASPGAGAAASARLDMVVPQTQAPAFPMQGPREKIRGLIAVAAPSGAQGHDDRYVHERRLRTNSARTNSPTSCVVRVQSVST